MEFAMSYAQENRRLMMHICKEIIADFIPGISFEERSTYTTLAKREVHEGREFWIHRKGATARLGQLGIIPGSMGTPSYIVEGLGNPASFQSCSHGAGRRMGRNEACRRLDPEECNRAMGDVVYENGKPRM
jgi:tRNA-splicing ligase RtcB